MNNILTLTEELKVLIIKSDEYKNYIRSKNIIDKNKELKKIILNIKEIQKIIVNKKAKDKNVDKEEFELKNLFNILNNNNSYRNYIDSSKKLNVIITKVQKRFEEYFNTFII